MGRQKKLNLSLNKNWVYFNFGNPKEKLFNVYNMKSACVLSEKENS